MTSAEARAHYQRLEALWVELGCALHRPDTFRHARLVCDRMDDIMRELEQAGAPSWEETIAAAERGEG